jgi:hypothetical protein
MDTQIALSIAGIVVTLIATALGIRFRKPIGAALRGFITTGMPLHLAVAWLVLLVIIVAAVILKWNGKDVPLILYTAIIPSLVVASTSPWRKRK